MESRALEAYVHAAHGTVVHVGHVPVFHVVAVVHRCCSEGGDCSTVEGECWLCCRLENDDLERSVGEYALVRTRLVTFPRPLASSSQSQTIHIQDYYISSHHECNQDFAPWIKDSFDSADQADVDSTMLLRRADTAVASRQSSKHPQMVRLALNAASCNTDAVYKAPRKLSSAKAADQQLLRD
jgi:hypothetical protein